MVDEVFEQTPHPCGAFKNFHFCDFAEVFHRSTFKNFQFSSFFFSFLHFREVGWRRAFRDRERRRFFEPTLHAALAVEEELGGNVLEVAHFELSLDGLQFAGEIGKLILEGGQVTLAHGFLPGESKLGDLDLVLMLPFGGEADGDFEGVGDVLEGFVLGAELDELVDGVLGVHSIYD
jgi:hypothetical protein